MLLDYVIIKLSTKQLREGVSKMLMHDYGG